MKKAVGAIGSIFALWAVLSIFPTVAQIPQFPQVLPPNTVVGRTGITAGPAQPIPIGTLFTLLFGSGASGLTQHAVMINEGTSAPNAVLLGDAQLLIGQTSADPAAKTLTGDVAIVDTGVATIQPNVVSNSKLAQAAANTVKSNVTNLTGNVADNPITSLGIQPVNIAARFGSMDVWQRGAGGSASFSVPASTTQYTVDGCYLATGANQASTVAAVAGIAAGSNKAAAVTRNSGQTGTGPMTFGCPLDSDEISLIRGQLVTLSLTLSTGANFSSTSTAAFLVCGTGAPIKQVLGYTGQTIPLTISLPATNNSPATRYQGTSAAVVPSNCTQAEFEVIWNPSGTAGAVDSFIIDNVQLELAQNTAWQASAFQSLDFSAQLLKAQRHFAKTFPYGTAPAQNAGIVGALGIRDVVNTVATAIEFGFPVSMRAAPTITTFNPSAANANCRDVTGATDLVVTVDPNTAISADRVYLSCAAGGAAGDNIYLHLQADAGI